MNKKLMKRKPKTLRVIVHEHPREPVTVPVTAVRGQPREPVTVFVQQLGPRRHS